MEYNRVSLNNKLTLNLAVPGDQGLALNRGEILKGQVQMVRPDGMVMLSIKGKLIEAASQVIVKTGDQLYLLVDDFRDGRAYMKVLNQETLGRMENASVAAKLVDMGLPADNEMVMLAKKLLQHNLPVTREHLNHMARGAALLGGFDSKNLEVTAFLLARNIPINHQILTAFTHYLSPEQDMAKLLQDILQLLARVPSRQANTSLAIPPASNQGAVDKSFLPAASNPSNLTGNTLSPNSAGKFSRLLTDMVNITRMIGEGNQVPAAGKQVEPQTGLTTGGRQFSVPPLPQMESSLNLLRTLVEALLVQINDKTPTQIEQKLRALVLNERDVLKGIHLIQDIASDQEKLVSNSPGLKQLLSRLEGLEKELVGQRIFNLAVRVPGDNQANFYYFSFPVTGYGENWLGQLRINQEKGKKSLKDQDNIHLVVSLDTPKLGIVLFDIDWHRNKLIKLQGIVENTRIASFLENKLNILIAGIAGLGYQVENRGIKVAEPGEQILRIRLNETGEKLRPFGIDITV